MKKRAIGRTISLVIAGIVIVAGVFFIVGAYCIRQKFLRQAKAKPIDIAVDLSGPGEFSGEFRQTWRACHGQTINLHVPTNLSSQVSLSNLSDSLEFKCQITDSKGNVVVDDKLAGRPILQDGSDNNIIPLLYFRPFDLGTYMLTFTVISGAPQLAGVEQRLVCQYQPCGLELLPAFFCKVLGIACLMVAGIIILIVITITKRARVFQMKSCKENEIC